MSGTGTSSAWSTPVAIFEMIHGCFAASIRISRANGGRAIVGRFRRSCVVPSAAASVGVALALGGGSSGAFAATGGKADGRDQDGGQSGPKHHPTVTERHSQFPLSCPPNQPSPQRHRFIINQSAAHASPELRGPMQGSDATGVLRRTSHRVRAGTGLLLGADKWRRTPLGRRLTSRRGCRRRASCRGSWREPDSRGAGSAPARRRRDAEDRDEESVGAVVVRCCAQLTPQKASVVSSQPVKRSSPSSASGDDHRAAGRVMADMARPAAGRTALRSPRTVPGGRTKCEKRHRACRRSPPCQTRGLRPPAAMPAQMWRFLRRCRR